MAASVSRRNKSRTSQSHRPANDAMNVCWIVGHGDGIMSITRVWRKKNMREKRKWGHQQGGEVRTYPCSSMRSCISTHLSSISRFLSCSNNSALGLRLNSRSFRSARAVSFPYSLAYLSRKRWYRVARPHYTMRCSELCSNTKHMFFVCVFFRSKAQCDWTQR